MVTRSKPAALVSGTSGTAGGITRPTLASKAKATAAESKGEPQVGKRKREALGEVIVAGNKPAGPTTKGKEKEVLDGVILKPRPVATRQPLRTVATRQKTAVTVGQKTTKPTEEDEQVMHNDHAMVIDPPAQVPLPSITTRRSIIPTRNVSAGVNRLDAGSRVVSRFSSHLKIEEEDEEPAHKKRRTSSVPPEEETQALEETRAQAEQDAHTARLAAEMEAFANEIEADPDNSPWDDLDEEDNDDPLMVSEYVHDIFKYLKQLEVRMVHVVLIIYLISIFCS